MLGWLLGVVLAIVGLVLHFDPEARRQDAKRRPNR